MENCLRSLNIKFWQLTNKSFQINTVKKDLIDALQFNQKQEFLQKYYAQNCTKNKISRLIQYYYATGNPFYIVRNSIIDKIRRQSWAFQSQRQVQSSISNNSSVFIFAKNFLGPNIFIKVDKNKLEQKLNYIPFRKKQKESEKQEKKQEQKVKYTQKSNYTKMFTMTSKTGVQSKRGSFTSHKSFK